METHVFEPPGYPDYSPKGVKKAPAELKGFFSQKGVWPCPSKRAMNKYGAPHDITVDIYDRTDKYFSSKNVDLKPKVMKAYLPKQRLESEAYDSGQIQMLEDFREFLEQ